MRRVPARFLFLGLLSLLGVAAALAVDRHQPSAIDISPREKKPALMLITTLPLVFPEEFTIEGGGSKVLTRLETRYRVMPIAATDRASLGEGRLLLMAHALPQTAEALVDLDRWVRGGGRVLLLADPRLQWPSNRPLGDKLRPPPSFADTGLLAHWGLELSNGPPRGAASTFPSPGQLHATQAGCSLEASGFVARCAIGRGKVTVIADADWLNVGEGEDENLGLLLQELARLER